MGLEMDSKENMDGAIITTAHTSEVYGSNNEVKGRSSNAYFWTKNYYPIYTLCGRLLVSKCENIANVIY